MQHAFCVYTSTAIRASPIANNDTETYITAAETHIPSWEAFTGRRLFTTNLLYAIFRPAEGYEILVNGSPATIRREIQPTFASLSVFQTIVSTLSWAALAWIFASRLKNGFLQIAAVAIIALFAYTPQLVDWDSLLASESLTFSLFALQFGLLILLVFRLLTDPSPRPKTYLLIAAWLVVVFFWTFLKDAHLYVLLLDFVALAVLFLFKPFRERRSFVLILSVLGCLAILFALGWTTARESSRSAIQLRNEYQANIFRYPARMDFMRTLGMPEPNSPDFEAWFSQHAQSGYISFLSSHPGYVLTGYFQDGLASFSTPMQPYFTAPEAPLRNALISLGSLLHPTSPVPLLLDTLLLMGIWFTALQRRDRSTFAWTWLASWLYFAAHIILFVNIFGDAYALVRHTLMATTMFRLFTWLFAFVLIELALQPSQPVLSARNESNLAHS